MTLRGCEPYGTLMKRSSVHQLLAVALLSALWPTQVMGQTQSAAGVVTALSGRANVARPALPQPIPLKFKDNLFLQDTINTAENSIVRALLGGKALATVRELSVFTITEEVGRSTVNLASGKMALVTARQRLRPGEVIEIRTPNAIAEVRGTVVVVEVKPAPTAQLTPGPATMLTIFNVLQGTIEVFTLGAPTTPVTVGVLQSVNVTGTTIGAVQIISSSAVAQLAAVAKAPIQHPDTPKEGQNQVVQNQQANATVLANVLTGQPAATSGPAQAAAPDKALQEASSSVASQVTSTSTTTATTTVTTTATTTSQAPVVSTSQPTATVTEEIQEAVASPPAVAPPPDVSITGTTVTPPDAFGFTLSGSTVVVKPKASIKSFSGASSRAGTSPVVQITGSTISQSSPDNLIQVNSGASASLAGPLLNVSNSTLSPGTNVLAVAGSLTSSTTSPLISLDTTTISSPGDMIKIEAGGSLTLAGPLLSAPGSTLTSAGSLLSLSSANVTTTNALITGQSGSTINSSGGAVLVSVGSSTIAGPLLSLTSSTLTLSNALLSTSGTVTSTGTAPWITLTSTNASAPSTINMLSIPSGTTLILAGPLLSASGSALTTTSSGSFLYISSATVTSTGSSLATLGSSATVTVGSTGSLLSLSSANVTTTNALIVGQTGSAITSGSSGALILVGGSTIAGPLLSLTSATLTLNDALLTTNGTVTSTGTAPWITLNGTNASTSTNATLAPGGTLTLAGPLLSAPMSTLTSSGLFGFLTGLNNTLTSTGASLFTAGSTTTITLSGSGASLILLSGSTIATTNALITGQSGSTINSSGGAVLVSVGSSTIAGPLLSLAGSTLTLSGRLLNVSGTVSSTGTSPWITLTSTNANSPVSLMVILSSANVTFAGPLLSAPGSTLTSRAGHVLVISSGATVTSTGASLFTVSPTTTVNMGTSANLLTLSSTTVTTTNPLITGEAGSQITGSAVQPLVTVVGSTVNGPLLSLTSSTLTLSNALLSTSGTVTSTGTAPWITLTSTNASAPSSTDLMTVAGTLTLAGPLLSVSNSTLSAPSASILSSSGRVTTTASLLAVSGNVTVSSAAQLINVPSGGTLTTTGATTSLISVGSNGTLTFGQPLLLTSSGTISMDGPVANLTGGAALVNNSSSDLVFISSGTHTIAGASGASVFSLTGSATKTEEVEGVTLTLGTDRPLRGPGGGSCSGACLTGSLVRTSGAMVTTQQLVKLDTALLEASAPLINMLNSSAMTSASDLVNLVQKAKLVGNVPGGALVNLNASTLTVTNGALINVAGGSFLHVTAGDLLFLSNGSTINIEHLSSGFLLNASGSSVVDVFGALVNFSGTGGNSIVVKNNLAPTDTILGIRIQRTGGALLANVTIQGTPIKGPGLGSITFPNNGSLISIAGPNTKVLIRGN